MTELELQQKKAEDAEDDTIEVGVCQKAVGDADVKQANGKPIEMKATETEDEDAEVANGQRDIVETEEKRKEVLDVERDSLEKEEEHRASEDAESEQYKEVVDAESEQHTDSDSFDKEEEHKDSEDAESDLEDSFIDDSDEEQPSRSDDDNETNFEEPLTDAEVEELIAEFLEVESKAAEAQESLEKESLARVEGEVRAELAQNLQGDELDLAVSTEMKTFKEDWERVLDDLEAESALLLEQLDGAGIELPSLYKWIESQAPNGCCTEAWKKRAHWVGSQINDDVSRAVADAENYLQSCRPVRRKQGRLLEEGAGGFLGKKLASEDNLDSLKQNPEKDWGAFNELIEAHRTSKDDTSFGGKHWASVYLASTPQQAANLGLKLPGVDEVEEIDDIECNASDPFYADAIANEKEIDLSEEQKKNFRKVKEEDDAKAVRKLQFDLKQRRHKKRIYQDALQKEAHTFDRAFENESRNSLPSDNVLPPSYEKSSDETGAASEVGSEENLKNKLVEIPDTSDDHIKDKIFTDDTCYPSDSIEFKGSKRSHDGEDTKNDNKKSRTVIIDSDGESRFEEKDVSGISEDADKFQCTACSKVLGASEVRCHSLLEVIICENCKRIVEEKMQRKALQDPDCIECFCGWCGRNSDLQNCCSCKMLFCSLCIKRNFGKEQLSELQSSGWRCCCCSPSLLQRLVTECDKALRIWDQLVSSSDSDSGLSDSQTDVPISKKRRKRKIRRILEDAELGEETKRKIAIEKARQEHLKSFAGKSWNKFTASFKGNAIDGVSIEVLGDATTGYIVNVAREEDEDPVRIPPSISAKLKPHQVAGIRFMWENIIQSVRKVKSGDKGLGCILAHTMGLGKTFQVIAFLYTAMRSVDLGLRTALIVTPVNVLHNWRQEFLKWMPQEYKPLRVYMLEDVPRERRSELLCKWRRKGGVLLIGYASFRNLSLGRNVKDRNMAIEIASALQNGPDILVCDEAHMIKNTRADVTYALKQVKCQRRIALTGSPLQNNLMEYYCMVDFVREGFLGSSHEFRNRFQNPIENGQHTNSTLEDVKIMNQRSHILYEQLKGFVQRMDMSVVKKDLPPKTVFVLTVKLSPLQKKLYKRFLDVHGFTNDKIPGDKGIRRRCFFAGYQALAQIWNHPGLLQMVKEHKSNLRREDAVDYFLVDDSSSDDNMEHDTLNGEKLHVQNDLLQKKNDNGFFREEYNWWNDLLHERIYREVDYSGKMVLLLDILSMSADVGDKALVFSQSLTTLDLIELYLSRLPRKGREGKYWKRGKDWYRLDGSTEGSERQRLVERFNDPKNRRVKCTLISTRAGSLGINLYAANRVIIVDGSWNPTYDLQAIYRVWRYGQTKPVYAYRLMAHGTMEEKIYKRQVTKEGLAARVVDRQQVHRTMSKEEILHLFDFGDDENADSVIDQGQESSVLPDEEMAHKQISLPLSKGNCSSDKLMDSLLSRHYPRWIANYHEHETLLQENEEERLSKEEQDLAWETFRRSLEWEEVQRVSIDETPRELTSTSNSTGNTVVILEDDLTQTKSSLRSRTVQRKCTNLAHLLTLRSQRTKAGSSTVCGECAQVISWETLKRDGKMR